MCVCVYTHIYELDIYQGKVVKHYDVLIISEIELKRLLRSYIIITNNSNNFVNSIYIFNFIDTVNRIQPKEKKYH